jgi:G3E family GTPase
MIALSSALRRVPVTIICGLHGAGKTTVLQQFLSEFKGGALAFVVVQPTSFNFDANLIRGLMAALERTQDVVYEVREDDEDMPWPEQMVAAVEECASSNKYEHLFIELSGGCSVSAAVNELESIHNVVCVIDALELLQEVMGQTPEDAISASADEAPTILLQKPDLLSSDELKKCRDFIQALRPDALIEDSHFGEIPQLLLTQALLLPEPAQTRELVTSTIAKVFTARRPFHPQRFHDLCFGDWPGIWRVKGFFWLATRMRLVGGFSLTGTSCSSGPGGHWWAIIPKEQWPKDEELRLRIETTWREPYGDRRQELVLLGDADAMEATEQRLQECLLTDREIELGATEWSSFTDPFPDWDAEMEE